MFNCDLKPNSVKTYMSGILRAFRWDMNREVYSRCKHALGKWEYLGRHTPTRKATEITLPEAKAIVSRIQDPWARLAGELMCHSSLRLGDINDVRWRQVKAKPELIVIHLVGGKNRRSQIMQEKLRLIPSDLSPWLHRQLCRGASRCPGDAALSKIEVKPMNDILQKTSGLPITTYSLRHAFHQDVIEKCTTNGEVDWKKVAERTLHRSEKTVKAHYDRA
jgi:integrase